MRWYDLQTLLPPVYAGIKSMFATAETENDELLGVKSYSEGILSNLFVQTCDVQTLEYWENLIGINLYGDETIESRRQMILLYLSNNWQITRPFVESRMFELFGYLNYSFEYDPSNNLIVRLHFYDSDSTAIKRFLDWFCKVCPAHIKWTNAHTERSQATNYIACGTTSHTTVTTSATMSVGTETLYLGDTELTVPWVEL